MDRRAYGGGGVSARRRSRGEGSIFRRKDGRYAATISLGWKNGKRARKTFYGRTQAEVRKQLQKAQADVAQGLPVALERQTVAAFLESWLTGTAKPRLRPRTYADYKKIVDKHLVPVVGHLQVSKLGPQHLQELFAAKTAEGLSARRVRVIRAVFHTAMDQALRWGLIGRNVVDLVRAPRVKRFTATTLTPEQAREFLDVAADHRLGALFSVALAVGLRLGEALGLEWQDIDTTKGTLRVRQALQLVDGKLVLGETKSEKSRRSVALPEFAVQVLKRHRVKQKKERLAAGSKWQASDFVFTTTVGTPLDDRNVRRAFHALLAEAELPRIRIHDLRHTCASLLLAQGVHAKVVQEILGHSQISLTLDTYSHVLPEVSKDAAKRMDIALRA